MAWIESHQELARHPKTKKIARLMGVSLPTAIGHLHLFWWWAMDYAQDGDLSKYDAADIADASEWTGEPELFLQSLVDAGFVDSDLSIHDWYDYAGRLIEKKEQNKERKRRSRARHTPVTETTAPQDSDGNEGHRATKPNLTIPNHTKPNNNTTTGTAAPVNPFKIFESEGFGTISSIITDRIGHMIDDYGERWVCEAMKAAVVAGKRNLGYVEGILKRYKSSGIDEPWNEPKPDKQPKQTYAGKSAKPQIPIVDESKSSGEVSPEELEELLRLAHKLDGRKGDDPF